LLSALTGTNPLDRVGGGVTVLPGGNFVVLDRDYQTVQGPIRGITQPVAALGAATWESGTTGLSGTVSAANSLLGIGYNLSSIGFASVTPLSNGNYVVAD